MKCTYSYEIDDAQDSQDNSSDASSSIDSEMVQPQEQRTINITVLSPDEVMQNLGFEEDRISWAYLIYDNLTNSSSQEEIYGTANS